MIELASVDAVCSARQLGDVIGVSSRQIERLTVDGVLKTVRGSGKFRARRYRLSDAVQAYLRHERDCLREKLSRNGSDDYEGARTRRMNAIALIEEARAAGQRRADQSRQCHDRSDECAERSQKSCVINSDALHAPARRAD
jgi:hypothetical protein